MIGRGAQGNPWIFDQINHFLEHGEAAAKPSTEEIGLVVCRHLLALHEFYGAYGGVKIARKHIGWYFSLLPGGKEFARHFNKIEDHLEQQTAIATVLSATSYFSGISSMKYAQTGTGSPPEDPTSKQQSLQQSVTEAMQRYFLRPRRPGDSRSLWHSDGRGGTPAAQSSNGLHQTKSKQGRGNSRP